MYTFQIEPDDGEPFQVVARMRDVLAWERANPGKTAQELTENTKLGDIYWIAHHAAKRQGKFDGTRQEFENSCDVSMGVSVVMPAASDGGSDGDAEGDGVDPTPPAP
jgi:hypothetical protein